MRHTALIGLTIAAALLVAPLASAQTFHRTYEFGPTYASANCIGGGVTGDCDPTDLTQDDSIDTGGANFEPDDVNPDATTLVASVVDDVWGTGVVAAYLGTDENGNNVVGEEDQGEVQVIFCGDSGPVEVGPPTDWVGVTIFVSYPGWAVEHCDPTQAPSATSGGVLDPAGGIYATFG